MDLVDGDIGYKIYMWVFLFGLSSRRTNLMNPSYNFIQLVLPTIASNTLLCTWTVLALFASCLKWYLWYWISWLACLNHVSMIIKYYYNYPDNLGCINSGDSDMRYKVYIWGFSCLDYSLDVLVSWSRKPDYTIDFTRIWFYRILYLSDFAFVRF